MKKGLPNVYANPVNKTISNVQEFYYGDSYSESRSVSSESIITKINRIFNSSHHVYKSRVKITTNEGIIEKEVVAKANGNLLTLDGQKIKILDIKDIEKI